MGVTAKEPARPEVNQMTGPLIPLPFRWTKRRDGRGRWEHRRRGEAAFIHSKEAGRNSQPGDEMARLIVTTDNHIVNGWPQRSDRLRIDIQVACRQHGDMRKTGDG
jgi:hypothetical protein